VDPGGLCREHTPGVGADDGEPGYHETLEPQRSANRALAAAARAGRHSGAVRARRTDSDAPERRLNGERKRICRLHTAEGLALRTKVRKKIARRARVPAQGTRDRTKREV
jgi:hypothetical protein